MKMRSHNSILVASLWAGLLAAQPVFAGGGTNVAPGIHVNEHWTLAGSPYYVQGDIQLSLVTIDPGAEILVDGPYEIEVLAALTAVGNDSQPILFTEKDDDDDWRGLKFQNVPPGSQLVHCIIEKSRSSGIRIIDSAPAIDHCTIRNNGAYVDVQNGGGLNISMSTGDLSVSNSTINNNKADRHGGGIYAIMGDGKLQLEGCRVEFNGANPEANAGSYRGGGVFVSGSFDSISSSYESNECRSVTETFADRDSRGGGLYLLSGDYSIVASVVADNSCVTSNDGSLTVRRARGAAIYVVDGSLHMTNVVMAGNTLIAAHFWEGAGLYNLGAAVDVQNSTIARNSHHGIWSNDGGGAVTTVDSSILYFNNADGDQVFGSVSIDFSDVQHPNPGYPGTGNINFHPVFQGQCDTAWDLSLVLGSSCIDAGNPAPEFDDVCFPPSLLGIRNDMGATGGPGACDLQIFNPADINRDGVVGIVDLLALLAAWGPCSGLCPGDTNCDANVNIQDLLFLLAHWG